MIHSISRRPSKYQTALATAALVAFSQLSLAQDVPQLPVMVPDSVWQPLRDELDPSLQASLEQEMAKDKNWTRLVANKKLAVSIVDLADPAHPRFARINGDEMMYAASLPKIAVLLAAMQRIEDGVLEETPEVMADLNAMIRKSSNGAATRSIDRAGGLLAIEEVLRDPRYELFDAEFGGGLWVGKRYSKSNKRNRDPLKGLSHAATVAQVSRFYYLLAQGRLVSPDRSAQMIDILSRPGINHKFVFSLRRIAPNASLYRKSGSWRDWHSDSALVWGPERRYIVVALTQDAAGEKIMRNLIPAIDRLLVHPELTTTQNL